MRDERLSSLWRGAALCLFLCSVSGGGCKRGGPPPLPVQVVQIQVAGAADPALGPSPAVEAALSEEVLVAAAQRGLKRGGVSYVPSAPESRPGDFRLRLEVLLQRAPAPPDKNAVTLPPLRALCAGQLRARTGSALSSDEASKQPAPELTRLTHVVAGERTLKTGEGDAVWSELAQRAVEDTAATLAEQLRLLGQPASVLVQAAGDRGRDAGVRGVAVQLLGLRKERSGLPVLLAILKEKREAALDPRAEGAEGTTLRDQAIGALVEIGDQSAVRPMLDVVTLGDRVEVGKLLEAVAALGGDEARRYLEFVSLSHSDERVRKDAKVALEHLQKRHAARDGGS